MKSAAAHDDLPPSAWVQRFHTCIAPGGRVLDLACGRGRHARMLASAGFDVVAADRDAEALGALAQVAGVRACEIDLENGAAWPWQPGSFDAVVVTNYLHRPGFDRLCGLVRAGGMLIYETFMHGNARFGRPANPDFLLAPHELLDRTRPMFTVVAFEQGETRAPSAAMRQRLCAVRGDTTGRLPDDVSQRQAHDFGDRQAAQSRSGVALQNTR